jgi:hypothetical protein
MEIKLEYWWNDWIVSSGSVFGRDVLVLLDDMVFFKHINQEVYIYIRVNSVFGPIKFSNLDFGPCKNKSTQFAPVKFKPIYFSPSFELSVK